MAYSLLFEREDDFLFFFFFAQIFIKKNVLLHSQKIV